MLETYPSMGKHAPTNGYGPLDPRPMVEPKTASLVESHLAPEASLEDMSDEHLVRLAQRGVEDPMEILCQRYRPLIRKYAKQSQMASEMVDTEAHLWYLFIKAIRDFHLEGPVPFAGYAKSVIRYGQSNLFQQLRRLWNREQVMSDGTEEDEHSQRTTLEAWPAPEHTEEDVLHQWELDTLSVAFQELMPPQQTLLQAVFYEHRSIADLAREHGISRQAMHKHYQRALTALRRHYEQVSTQTEEK